MLGENNSLCLARVISLYVFIISIWYRVIVYMGAEFESRISL